MSVSARDGEEVAVWSADSERCCAAVQRTESPALGSEARVLVLALALSLWSSASHLCSLGFNCKMSSV